MTALFERLTLNVPKVRNHPVLVTERTATAASDRQPGVVPSYKKVTMEGLIHEIGSLPQGCVLVGACDDRNHFYMDLRDPRPGSVLIAGEKDGGQARLLQAVLSSAALLNSHRTLRYTVFSDHTASFTSILQQPHCYRIVSPSSQSAGRAITSLADLAEKRMKPSTAESLLVLAIDGLDDLCAQIDDQAYADLAWLIRNGPALHIWPFATLDIHRANLVGADMIDLFGTSLLGYMDARHTELFQGDASVTSRLDPGKQFCVWFDDTWLTFWVPEPAALPQSTLRV